MNVQEAAKALGLSVGRIRQLCLAGVMGRKKGRDWLITPEEVEHYQKTRRPPGRPREDEEE